MYSRNLDLPDTFLDNRKGRETSAHTDGRSRTRPPSAKTEEACTLPPEEMPWLRFKESSLFSFSWD
jgi:hypothetical protein